MSHAGSKMQHLLDQGCPAEIAERITAAEAVPGSSTVEWAQRVGYTLQFDYSGCGDGKSHPVGSSRWDMPRRLIVLDDGTEIEINPRHSQ
jgi:hypothetical protein